ncbi:MAG: TauD/TfdA family dioxygenase, partial [Okeania sp. SIO2H7]|nr:TauD/TfdA family dioxygenase [Okeania sp. SIO2H7]
MNLQQLKKPSLKRIANSKRRGIKLSPKELIKIDSIQPESKLPVVIQPPREGLNLVSWAADNRELIETHLLKEGGILFRNFQLNSIGEFE